MQSAFSTRRLLDCSGKLSTDEGDVMIEWGPATKASAERQAAAIRTDATEARHHRLADRAERGEFTDYSDAHSCPITELHRLCRQFRAAFTCRAWLMASSTQLPKKVTSGRNLRPARTSPKRLSPEMRDAPRAQAEQLGFPMIPKRISDATHYLEPQRTGTLRRTERATG